MWSRALAAGGVAMALLGAVRPGIIDSGADDSAAEATIGCGLAPSPNAECAACIATSCCGPSRICGADQTCVDGFACVKSCLSQLFCITGCLGGDSGQDLSDVLACSQMNCPKCTPGPQCQKLGKCGILLSPDAGQQIIINVVRSTILDLDETKCTQQLANMGTYSDASACQTP